MKNSEGAEPDMEHLEGETVSLEHTKPVIVPDDAGTSTIEDNGASKWIADGRRPV